MEEAAPIDVPALSQQTSSPPAEADSRAEDGLSEEELDGWLVKDMKPLLKELGLKVSGTKAELKQRLLDERDVRVGREGGGGDGDVDDVPF